MDVSEWGGFRVGQVFKHKHSALFARFVRIRKIYLSYRSSPSPWFCMDEYMDGEWYRSMIGTYTYDEINRWTDLFAESTEEFERKINGKD